MQIINNQPQHDSPKNDQNSSSSPPNNSKKHQQNNQSQQRRTAAERRASHRRRSTAQANELVQLAQLRKGIEKSRTSQDSPNIEKIAEEHSTKEENSEKTMIIPNQQMDNSTKTTKNILTTTDSDEFPPEPTITAPGSEEEEFVNNENICINLLEEEQVATLMLFEPSPTSSTTSPPIRITPKTTTNKNIPDIPPSTHPFKQKYYHQRSISDHLLNYSSSKNIQKQQLKNQEKPFGEDNNPLPPPKYIYSSQLDSESPLNLQNNKYNNINTKFSMAAATTKKKAPILAQIRRLKREEEFNDQMSANDYNTEPEEEEDNDDKYYESSAIEDDDIEFTNRLSRPQQRLNRVCSGDGELVKLRNVHNNEDDFSPPPPSFTTTPTSLSSFSALKAATALAGVNLSLARGLENSSIPTSNTSTPSNTKTKNSNKKSASFSSTPSSSSGIANLFSLGNRFSTNRQNSDSSLLRRNSQKVEEQQQQNLLCSRRSFKWKNLWGRKNSGTSIDDSNIVVGSNVSKGGSNVSKGGSNVSNVSTPTGSLFSTKRASSQLLDTLIEDTETFSISGGSKEDELKQKRRLKRHSALLLVEGNDKEEGKGIEEEGKERSFNQNANTALTPVRFRTANQMLNSSSKEEKSERREEEKTECQEILSSSILQQRPFSIIGTGQDSEPSLISSSKVHNMLSVEEEDSSEQQLLPNEQLARYRIEEDLLERFDEFLFKCRRKGLRTLRNVNEDSFGMEEEEEGEDNGREEEEMRKIIKKSSKNRGRDGKLDKEEDNSLQKSATSSTLLKKPNHKKVERTAPPLPPRLSRATRRSTNCSPILYISTCQTLDRRQSNKKLALHRAVSSRANNLTNLTTSSSPFSYTSTLTLPRKRPPPRGVSTQQRRRGNITSAATRRKSIVQLAVEDSVELAAIVAAVEEHEKEDLKGEGGGDGEGHEDAHEEGHEEGHEEVHEEVKEVERVKNEAEARQVEDEKQKLKETKQQTQQQQPAMFRVKSSKHLTTSTNHHSTKCAIFRHLLGATTNNNNNRVCGGGKVAPKNNGTLITSSNNNLGNATISGGSCVAEMAIDGAANRTISKDNKKRETKTNSMILGTIWSIRPRRKKESNAQRSLVNLWASQSPTENISANIAADVSVANKSCPNGNGDFMNNIADQQQLLQQQNLSQHQSSLLQSPSSTTANVGSSSPFCSPTSTTTDGIFHHNNGPSTASSNFFPRAQLQHSRWADLELWTEQETSWTAKYCVGSDNEFSSLSAKEMKRQNIIYELVLTERHHCQVLVLLQQLYYEGLAHNRILTPKQLQLLIPDVEALLDFHLSFLRSLIERCSQSPIVDEISDILLTEFGSGNFRNNAINSYTAFCLGREDSAKQYSTLIAQNIHFRKFMEYYEGQHKDRSLKDCMLLVAQRLTKYPVLVEQIAKQESQPSKQLLAQKAHSIVREFAMQVDQQLMQHELNKKWTALKKALDKSAAIAKLIHPKDGIDFSFDDLVWPVENDSTITLTNLTKTIGRRQILLITRAFWRETMNGPELELRLLLCDDVIVFLRPKGGGGGSSSSTVNVGSNSNAANTKLPPLQFFRHISHSGVLPLHSILVRGENVRRKSLLLIVTAKQRPDLFEFAFPTSVELENFALAIKKAKAEAPNFVRLADGKCFEFADKPIGDGMGKPIINSDDFKTQMENWKLELDQLFEQRSKEEADLEHYFEARMLFMDRLRTLVERIPRRKNKQKKRRRRKVEDNEDKNEENLTKDEENEKEEEEGYRMQQKAAFEHLRNRFRELERTRVEPLVRLIDKAKKMRDADLIALFDDFYDLGGEVQQQQEEQVKEKCVVIATGSGDSATSAEEQPRASDEDRRPKPRRVRTYHGATDKRKKGNSDGSSCSSSGGASAIRRHTTFPSSGRHDASSDDEDDEEEEDECLRQLLPLRMGAGARRVATDLIRENLRLRTQLNRLKAKTALQEIWLTAAMQKVINNDEIIIKQEDEENKQLKDEELALNETKVLKIMARDLARREAEIERKEAQLKAREEETLPTLPSTQQKPSSSYQHSPSSTSLQSPSNTKYSNIEKKTSFKGNKQQKNHQQQLLQLEKQKEFDHHQSVTTTTSPSTSTKSTTTIRINNTYCGAGPIPTSTLTNSNNTKNNSNTLLPSSISNSHLIQSNKQQFNNNKKCSITMLEPNNNQNNNISFERRALSHAELPVHLAVKTETKQRRK